MKVTLKYEGVEDESLHLTLPLGLKPKYVNGSTQDLLELFVNHYNKRNARTGHQLDASLLHFWGAGGDKLDRHALVSAVMRSGSEYYLMGEEAWEWQWGCCSVCCVQAQGCAGEGGAFYCQDCWDAWEASSCAPGCSSAPPPVVLPRTSMPAPGQAVAQTPRAPGAAAASALTFATPPPRAGHAAIRDGKSGAGVVQDPSVAVGVPTRTPSPVRNKHSGRAAGVEADVSSRNEMTMAQAPGSSVLHPSTASSVAGSSDFKLLDPGAERFSPSQELLATRVEPGGAQSAMQPLVNQEALTREKPALETPVCRAGGPLPSTSADARAPVESVELPSGEATIGGSLISSVSPAPHARDETPTVALRISAGALEVASSEAASGGTPRQQPHAGSATLPASAEAGECPVTPLISSRDAAAPGTGVGAFKEAAPQAANVGSHVDDDSLKKALATIELLCGKAAADAARREAQLHSDKGASCKSSAPRGHQAQDPPNLAQAVQELRQVTAALQQSVSGLAPSSAAAAAPSSANEVRDLQDMVNRAEDKALRAEKHAQRLEDESNRNVGNLRQRVQDAEDSARRAVQQQDRFKEEIDRLRNEMADRMKRELEDVRRKMSDDTDQWQKKLKDQADTQARNERDRVERMERLQKEKEEMQRTLEKLSQELQREREARESAVQALTSRQQKTDEALEGIMAGVARTESYFGQMGPMISAADRIMRNQRLHDAQALEGIMAGVARTESYFGQMGPTTSAADRIMRNQRLHDAQGVPILGLHSSSSNRDTCQPLIQITQANSLKESWRPHPKP